VRGQKLLVSGHDEGVDVHLQRRSILSLAALGPGYESGIANNTNALIQ
jgi:hypothetical protein